MRVLRGKRELGLGATPSLRFALEIWGTCSGRELNRGFAGGPAGLSSRLLPLSVAANPKPAGYARRSQIFLGRELGPRFGGDAPSHMKLSCGGLDLDPGGHGAGPKKKPQ